jgi:hypothetical protein
MKRMTSLIVKSLSAVLISSGLLATAHAQYDPGITVDIPFAFSSDGQEIAAGTYQLQLVSSNFLLSVRNVNTGNEQFIGVHPEEDRKVTSVGRLIFQVCEGHRYLTQIHIPGGNLFSETVDSRRQKDAEARTCTKDDSVTVAAR